MSRTKEPNGGPQGPLPLACPNCGLPASADHFKESRDCADVAARLRAMLNVSQRKHAVAGPGRPKGAKDKGPRKEAAK